MIGSNGPVTRVRLPRQIGEGGAVVAFDPATAYGAARLSALARDELSACDVHLDVLSFWRDLGVKAAGGTALLVTDRHLLHCKHGPVDDRTLLWHCAIYDDETVRSSLQPPPPPLPPSSSSPLCCQCCW